MNTAMNVRALRLVLRAIEHNAVVSAPRCPAGDALDDVAGVGAGGQVADHNAERLVAGVVDTESEVLVARRRRHADNRACCGWVDKVDDVKQVGCVGG